MKLAMILPVAAFAAISASTSIAVPITIGSGNRGDLDVENVLFKDGLNTGTLVEGSFNEAPDVFVEFVSTSTLETPSNGQAQIAGPFTDLNISLADDATFTAAIFNLDAILDGQVQILVSYMNPIGSVYEELFTVNGSGQNFINIVADDGAVITEIDLLGIGTSFSDVRQIRLGGFQTTVGVPDGGATIGLLGLGVLGLFAVRRKTS